ncbi:cache domain-containing protein, partial [Paenibacillus sepulcri]|nr:cache domain-containing protein [Paenibacillus sepulcri]
MNIFHLYKSKKYLGRIIVSFSILILLLLALFSSALYYNSEKIVLDMQREANKKVLSQIKFNVTYLNDVIQKLVTSLYYDNDVIPLMTATDNSDVFEMLRKRSRIDKFADYTPFIHSIIIYNANTDQFVWGGDPVLQDRDAPIYAALREMFKAGKPIPKLKMLPMSLDGQEGGKADFFSIFNYDSIVYQPGQSAFILNIKPQWLFDNIKLINQLAWEENENVFIMSDDGSVITPDTDTPELTGDFRQAIMDRIDAATRADDGSGAFNYSISDKKKIVNYLNTGINGWTLVSIQPYETLVKKAESLKNTSIVLTLIFVLLSLLTILGVSHRLYRPLGKLVSFIRGDAGGEAETEPPGGDELTYMSSVYEQTIQRLKAARSEQHTTRSIVRSYYIRKIVTDSQALSREQLLEWIQQHKLAMNPAGPYMLSVMKLDGSTDSANSGDEKERSLLHFAIANIAQEMLSRTYLCEAVEMKSEHLVAVISTRDEAELTETGVRGVMSQIQDAIARM